MSKHRHRSVAVFYTNELELDDSKFCIKKEAEGQYAIYNITQDVKVMVKRVKDKDDEYALNCIKETLDYITREI